MRTGAREQYTPTHRPDEYIDINDRGHGNNPLPIGGRKMAYQFMVVDIA
jgi:hypothetical protein